MKATLNPPVMGLGGWIPPTSLKMVLTPVEAFNIELLPERARQFIVDEAYRMQAPIDYLAVTLLTMLGSVIGRQICIRPKAKDSWEVVPNLWGMLIGRSATFKSPSTQAVLQPLKKLEEAGIKQYETDMKKFLDCQYAANIKKKQLEKSQKLEDLSVEEITEKLNISNELPPQPSYRRYLTNDATVEKLGEILHNNPLGILVFRDELNGFFQKLEQVGHESDRAFYLEAWNGNGSFTVDRITRGTIYIPGLCLSILGGIQPSVVTHLFNQVTQQKGSEDGFIQRFQILVWPDEVKLSHIVDEFPNKDARENFQQLLKELSEIDTASVGVLQDDPGSIPYLRFSPEAQEIFNDWLCTLNVRLIHELADNPALEAHLGKYRSLVPSIALICHLSNGNKGPVTVTALEQALGWVQYLESHAMRAYNVGQSYHLDAAQMILKRIKEGKLLTPFTLRELKRKHWRGLDDLKTLELALEELVDCGYLKRQEAEPTLGRPSEVFSVNPLWLKEDFYRENGMYE